MTEVQLCWGAARAGLGQRGGRWEVGGGECERMTGAATRLRCQEERGEEASGLAESFKKG